MEWLVDPFNQGELTALEDAEEVLGRLIGYQVSAATDFTIGLGFNGSLFGTGQIKAWSACTQSIPRLAPASDCPWCAVPCCAVLRCAVLTSGQIGPPLRVWRHAAPQRTRLSPAAAEQLEADLHHTQHG